MAGGNHRLKLAKEPVKPEPKCIPHSNIPASEMRKTPKAPKEYKDWRD